jgi:Ca2+-binding RTX toxin-like protein
MMHPTISSNEQLSQLVGIQSTANYQPIGSEFRVDTGAPTTRVTGPQVAMAANGDFVTVWQTPFSNADSDLYFRRFNANGTPKDSFDRSITTSVRNEFNPAVAMAADGRFAVTWTEINTNGDQDVYFQRFSAAGDKLGTAVLVNTFADSKDQYNADIAMYANGDFVITWTHEFSATDQDIFMRGFRSDGTPLTGDLGVATSGVNQFDSSIDVRPIAETGATSAVVSWTNGATNTEDIFFQRYDGNLSFLGSGQANVTIENSDDESSVALDGAGNFAIAWTHEFSSTGGDDDIRLRRFSANGTALTSSDQIVAQPGGDQDEPALAMSNDGRFVVAYEDDNNETVNYLEYSSNGTQVGFAQQYDVNHRFEDNPAIAINGNGVHMVIAADDDNFNAFDPTARKFQSLNQNDLLVGGGGNDNISLGGGNDTLNGRGGNDILRGNAGNDILLGESGADQLTGGSGADQLTGGVGKDLFVFGSKTEGRDTITDFLVLDDTIRVSRTGFGGGLTAGAVITAAQFRIGSAAGDASDRVIYNKANGALLFDADGTGASAQVQFAQLSTGLAMTNNDIFVIA